MTTLTQKVMISVYSTLLFSFVNLPQTYKFMNKIIPYNLYNNCPTHLGLIVHTSIFFLLTFLSMGNPTQNIGVKLKHTIYGTLIFYLISSPAFFYLINSLLGTQFANINGCPTLSGIGLHSFVYFVLLVGLMYLPERNT